MESFNGVDLYIELRMGIKHWRNGQENDDVDTESGLGGP